MEGVTESERKGTEERQGMEGGVEKGQWGSEVASMP